MLRKVLVTVALSMCAAFAAVALFAAGAAPVAAPVATLTLSAEATTPPLVSAGDSDSTQYCSTLTPARSGEENLTVTRQWWDIASVSASSDDVHWTTVWTAPSGGSPTAVGPGFKAAIEPSTGASATLVCTLKADGFYQVAVQTSADYSVVISGKTETGGPIISKMSH